MYPSTMHMVSISLTTTGGGSMNTGTRNEYMSPHSPQDCALAEYYGDMYSLRVPEIRPAAPNVGRNIRRYKT
jgi:hypothetical protein